MRHPSAQADLARRGGESPAHGAAGAAVQPLEHASRDEPGRLNHGDAAELGRRPVPQLRRDRRPGRIVIGADELNAIQAWPAARLHERPDRDAAIADHDRQVRDVAAQPAAVILGRDHPARHDHREVGRARVRIREHPVRPQHSAQLVGERPVAADGDPRAGCRRIRRL